MAGMKSKLTKGINHKDSQFKIREGTPLPLGIRLVGKRVYFSISLPNVNECKLNIYHKDSKLLCESILLGESKKAGSIFFLAMDHLDYHQYEYMYEVDAKEFIDPYARLISTRGDLEKKLYANELLRGGFYFNTYPWDEDRPLKSNYEDLIIYRIHVRGFTKDISSKVKNKGTFKGIIEKIPYLLDLGITAIELLPSYEFDEIIKEPNLVMMQDITGSPKINYWGYTNTGNYFAPKCSYAADTSNPTKEFKDLVKALHKAGIEIIMEFYFEPGTNEQFMIDCFRYWVLEYHIDGIKMNQNAIYSKLIATDPFLSDTKIFGLNWNVDEIYKREFIPKFKNLAEYNDGFLTDIRHFLKSDEEQVSKVAHRFKRNPLKAATINYIANTNGFTLMDLVSYDVKHNEENNEKGRDGTDYNYSWNCGVEGYTKRKKVLELRKKQIKNALVLLIFSQGVPLILSGDEFGNSQNGNNNPYCQDNKTSWLDWKLVKTNKEIYDFVKFLLSVRKNHPILHGKEELRGMDYASCGYPDLSFHGTKAWYPDYTNYSRILGVMLCGRYAMKDRAHHDDSFYIAFNMHWEDYEFDMPKLTKGENWYVLIDTATNHSTQIEYDARKKPESILKNQKKYLVKSRSIVVFIGK